MGKKQQGLIHLPGDKLHRFLTEPVGRQEPPEAFEVYPDELPHINEVGAKINAMFKYKNINNDEWPQLIERIIEMFDAIGFEVGVEVMDAFDGAGRPILGDSGFPMRVPSIAFLGRSKNKETEIDHDRMRHGIVNGLVDGKKGYVREGSPDLHEEPRKKLIY